MDKGICITEGCDRPSFARGYCQRCYGYHHRRGTLPPRTPKWNDGLAMTHGEEKLRKVWRQMYVRCKDPRDKRYNRYGGRGIRVCEEWSTYEPFRAWALANGYQAGLTIDRKENDGPYEPANCRWVTRAEQNRNYARNRFLTAYGETKTIKDWAADARCVVSYAALLSRFHTGWDDETALTTPALTRGRPR